MENLVLVMGWGARAVLVFLFLLSIWSVAIMFDRRKAFRSIAGVLSPEDAKKFIQIKDWSGLKTWAGAQQGIVGGLLLAALDETGGNVESIDRAVQSYLSDQRVKLEKGVGALATLGSIAPFIGLFGTVLGIIQSFGILSNAQGSAMNAVMLGLAEALISTAVGLFVAIPAVVAYNYFSQQLRGLLASCHSIHNLFVAKKIG